MRDKFLGPYRTETNPIAVERGQCGNTTELGGNHCGSLHKKLSLEPGEEIRFIFMLGVGSRSEKGYSIKKKYSDFKNVDDAFAVLRKYWNEKQSILQCKTPHEGLDTMINTWTLYQAETCVVWSRFASFVEVGGRTGLGYRDTSQDIMGVVHSNPNKSRQRILELLNGLTSQGYGLHLFNPEVFEQNKDKLPGVKLPTVVPSPNLDDIIHGLEDVCADDALWLVVSICDYIKETGDDTFFDYLAPYADGNDGSIYEHLTKILDFSTRHVGQSGICQGLRADWNDCLNLGGGESAMVSFMHYWALNSFIEAAQYLNRTTDVDKYSKIASKVKASCENGLWDGDWYIRGFTKTGDKIGTHTSDEGKIYLNAQTWAVYSEVASKSRAIQAMDAVHDHLYSDYGLHLLSPAYSKPNDDIGYVTRVYKGIKENAAIFSHPNPWAIIAECKLGRGTRAMKYYDAILPYNQNDMIETREAEPYSYCQFVMGKDHTAYGRARHPWLTGTASWMYVAATRYIIGLQFTFDSMILDPCIPSDWPEFTVTRKWRGATFNINVKNPDGVEKGIIHMTLDGELLTGAIPAQKPDSHHEIQVLMGNTK